MWKLSLDLNSKKGPAVSWLPLEVFSKKKSCYNLSTLLTQPLHVCCKFSLNRGQWNVPYMTEVLLIHGYLIPKLHGGYKDQDLDTDMALCKRAREKVMSVDGPGFCADLIITTRNEVWDGNDVSRVCHRPFYLKGLLQILHSATNTKFLSPIQITCQRSVMQPTSVTENSCNFYVSFPLQPITTSLRLINQIFI